MNIAYKQTYKQVNEYFTFLTGFFLPTGRSNGVVGAEVGTLLLYGKCDVIFSYI